MFFSNVFTVQHQQQVVTAVERAKQVTMSELNSIIGVSTHHPHPVLGLPQIENPVQSFLIKRFAHLKRSKCKFAFKVFKNFSE